MFLYYRYLDYQTHKMQKTVGDVSGSGKKPAAQKGRGMARVGNLRAPHRWRGGAAHGAKPRDYSISMNKKTRLVAMKALLSARLYEEKLILIDSEELPFPKTKYLNAILEPYKRDKLLFLTGFDKDANFELAFSNLNNIRVLNP